MWRDKPTDPRRFEEETPSEKKNNQTQRRPGEIRRKPNGVVYKFSIELILDGPRVECVY